MIVRLWRGARLRSRHEYYFVVTIMWGLTILWIAGLICLGIYRNEMPITVVVIALIAFCIMAPDFKTLFYPSRKYVEEWERDNEVEDGG